MRITIKIVFLALNVFAAFYLGSHYKPMNNSKYLNNTRLIKLAHMRSTIFPTTDKFKPRGIAVFDWDNTVINGDAGDAVFNWLISGDIDIPDKKWYQKIPFLTEDTKFQLDSSLSECMEKHSCERFNSILKRVYYDFTNEKNNSAYAGYNVDLLNPSYALLSYMFSGWDEDELIQTISNFFKNTLKNEKSSIGKRDIFKKIFEILKSSNIKIIILTASPSIVISSLCEVLDIHPDLIVGIPHKTAADLTITSPPLPVVEGSMVIPFKKGKIHFLKAALTENNLEGIPIVFTAGDSASDCEFMNLSSGNNVAVLNNEINDLHYHALSSENWYIWKQDQ
ncbi:MAG: hypothetical protein JXR95_12470 [Deltaproteobacteria bacterium]|nr:hypothetical protein [Deltaproteobacteria bacterium]